jgi:diguanylate cyclase (GGDEF)-like protein
MSARNSRDVTELVPLVDRVRWMAACRIATVATMALLWWLTPAWGGLAAPLLVPGAVLMLASVLAAAVTPRLPRTPAVALFTAALLADGAYLAWTLHLTGGVDSPAAYLAAVQVTAAALLGSFGTGLKLALWHSLATLIVLEAQATQLLPPPGSTTRILTMVDLRGYTLYLLPVWTAALVTATFAAVNERELRRRRYDADALRRLAVEMERSEEPGAVGAELLRFVTDELGATAAAATFWPVDGPSHRRAAALPPTIWTSLGDRTPELAWEEPPGELSLLRLAVEQEAPLLIAGFRPQDDPFLARVMPADADTVLVPLHVHESIRGALAFQHPSRRGSGIERRTLGAAEQAAAHAAMGLARAVLLTGLRAAANTDGLTELPNRRAFDEALRRDLASAESTGRPVGLVLIDLDHFKRLNDENGHLAGDDVLRAVGAVLRRQARQGDTPARYGGEELALVLPGADLDGATATAERVRAAIAALVGPRRITASVGVAVYPNCAVSGAELVAAADRALYAAKRNGRNQVQVAAPLSEQIPAPRHAGLPAVALPPEGF